MLRTITGAVQKSIRFTEMCVEEKADVALVWNYPLNLHFPRGAEIPTYNYTGDESLLTTLEWLKEQDCTKIFVYANLDFYGDGLSETQEVLKKLHAYSVDNNLDVVITLQTERGDTVRVNNVEF